MRLEQSELEVTRLQLLRAALAEAEGAQHIRQVQLMQTSARRRPGDAGPGNTGTGTKNGSRFGFQAALSLACRLCKKIFPLRRIYASPIQALESERVWAPAPGTNYLQ